METRAASALARRRQKGGTNLAVAGSLAGLLGMTALVIDVAQVLVTHSELQTVADLAAKSAAQELTRVYMDTGRLDPNSDTLTSFEKQRIAAAADRRARKNSAGDVSIRVDAADVRVGQWNNDSGAFTETNVGVNAVQVTARRDTVANGLVNLIFPGVLGQTSIPLHSTAASKLSGISYVPAGVADFPIGISKHWYATHASPCAQDNKISFYPTGTADGCAGWHTFEEDPASAAALKNILNGLRTGSWTSPDINVLDTQFMFSGGTITSAFNELERLYNAKKSSNGEMRVLIPVYDRDDCSNPNGWIRIIGVARAVVTKVVSGSDKLIEARVECDVVKLSESGGRDFGVLAGGPDLVR